MIKLLNASFTRLRKNKLFWLLTLFSIGLAIFMVYAMYNDMKNYGDIIKLEQLIFNYSTSIAIPISIFISLFLGVEYSDGAIRNKISIGHKRTNIYLSNLIIILLVSLFSYILFMLVIFLLGMPIFGTITLPISKFIILMSCIFVTIITYSSIFTFLAMIISNKTITAIVSIMLAFGMMITAITCMNILYTPKTIQEAKMVDGETKMEEVPNPKYPSEKKKKVCQTLLNINPTGQMFQIADNSISNIKKLPLYSLGIIVIFTASGIMLFKKKELK
ncbi:MAG: ABC transporter permease subunit [Bacilli bacterium]|nr:ABC transporter permease subunit [Bacilli bacterium]